MIFKSKKAVTEFTVDIFFMAFFLAFAFAGVLIFSYQVSQDELESFTSEKTIYINHIFSSSECLAYESNGIVMPYFVNYEQLFPEPASSDEIKDIKGCLNLDSDINSFSMLISFYPKGLDPVNVSYDYESFKSWRILPPTTNLYRLQSERKVTFIKDGKEYEGSAVIYSMFPK
jgi:hypothetical protein